MSLPRFLTTAIFLGASLTIYSSVTLALAINHKITALDQTYPLGQSGQFTIDRQATGAGTRFHIDIDFGGAIDVVEIELSNVVAASLEDSENICDPLQQRSASVANTVVYSCKLPARTRRFGRLAVFGQSDKFTRARQAMQSAAVNNFDGRVTLQITPETFADSVVHNKVVEVDLPLTVRAYDASGDLLAENSSKTLHRDIGIFALKPEDTTATDKNQLISFDWIDSYGDDDDPDADPAVDTLLVYVVGKTRDEISEENPNPVETRYRDTYSTSLGWEPGYDVIWVENVPEEVKQYAQGRDVTRITFEDQDGVSGPLLSSENISLRIADIIEPVWVVAFVGDKDLARTATYIIDESNFTVRVAHYREPARFIKVEPLADPEPEPTASPSPSPSPSPTPSSSRVYLPLMIR